MTDTPPEPGARPAAPLPATTKRRDVKPWWMPEARVWVAIALFGLAWRALELIAAKPDLSKDTLFVSIATSLFGAGGVLAIIGFYYMASKKDPQGQGGPQ